MDVTEELICKVLRLRLYLVFWLCVLLWWYEQPISTPVSQCWYRPEQLVLVVSRSRRVLSHKHTNLRPIGPGAAPTLSSAVHRTVCMCYQLSKIYPPTLTFWFLRKCATSITKNIVSPYHASAESKSIFLLSTKAKAIVLHSFCTSCYPLILSVARCLILLLYWHHALHYIDIIAMTRINIHLMWPYLGVPDPMFWRVDALHLNKV